MSRVLWETLLAALDDVDGLIAGAIPPGTVAGKGIGVAALRVLRAEIRGRLDDLAVSLSVMYDQAEADRMLLPLVFFLDEVVMAQLPLEDKLAWPLLQEDVLTGEDGGEVFYKNADDLLEPPAGDPALEIYYYCLESGFHGRFEDAASIEVYKRKLRNAIALGDAAAASTPATDTSEASESSEATGTGGAAMPHQRVPTAVYIAGTAVLAVMIYVLPTLLSNL